MVLTWVAGGDMGDAEIQYLGLAGFLNQNVAGLQVAMNDTLIVGMLHGVAHPGNQLDASASVETVTAGVLIQGQPADKLHGEERPAVVTHPRFVNLGDTRMLEPGQDLCFVLESIDELA
jgi:hypothetical protein